MPEFWRERSGLLGTFPSIMVPKLRLIRCSFYFSLFHEHVCAKSCLTLCDPVNCSLPGSIVYGILQARILKWVAMPFSGGSSQPRDQTCISCGSCIASRLFTNWATREALPFVYPLLLSVFVHQKITWLLPLRPWICSSPLYILDTSRLSNLYTANIFFKSVACIFSLLRVSFDEQMFLTFLKYKLLIFSFGVLFKKLPNTRSQNFSLFY